MGLGNQQKRRQLFHWLRSNHEGIWLLQETHSTRKTEKLWKHELGKHREIFFSHGRSNANGVAIIMPKKLNYTVVEIRTDDAVHYIILQLIFGEVECVLINVYEFTKDKPTEQVKVLKDISENVTSYTERRIPIILRW